MKRKSLKLEKINLKKEVIISFVQDRILGGKTQQLTCTGQTGVCTPSVCILSNCCPSLPNIC